jgi:small neutral amino acid transporter SnatA (MarC family)
MASYENEKYHDDSESHTFARRFLSATVEYAVFVIAGPATALVWMLFHANRSASQPNFFVNAAVFCVWTAVIARFSVSILPFMRRRLAKYQGIGESGNVRTASHH